MPLNPEAKVFKTGDPESLSKSTGLQGRWGEGPPKAPKEEKETPTLTITAAKPAKESKGKGKGKGKKAGSEDNPPGQVNDVTFPPIAAGKLPKRGRQRREAMVMADAPAMSEGQGETTPGIPIPTPPLPPPPPTPQLPLPTPSANTNFTTRYSSQDARNLVGSEFSTRANKKKTHTYTQIQHHRQHQYPRQHQHQQRVGTTPVYFGPGGYTNTRTYTAPQTLQERQFRAQNKNLGHIGAGRSPVVPKGLSEYVEQKSWDLDRRSRAEMVRLEEKVRLKGLNRRVGTAEEKEGDVLIGPLMGAKQKKVLETGKAYEKSFMPDGEVSFPALSMVLNSDTVWGMNGKKLDKKEVMWPDLNELKAYGGMGESKNGFRGACFPPPRYRNFDSARFPMEGGESEYLIKAGLPYPTAIWQQREVMKFSPMDNFQPGLPPKINSYWPVPKEPTVEEMKDCLQKDLWDAIDKD